MALKGIAKTLEKDRGFKKAMGELAKLSRKPYLKVGVQADAGIHPEGNFTVANIGATQEFGTKEAGRENKVYIPPRPWLGSTFTEKKEEFEQFQDKLAKLMLAGKSTLEDLLERLGFKMTSAVKGKISEGDPSWPPLSRATIEAKGSTKALIDTGFLRNKVTHIKGFDE